MTEGENALWELGYDLIACGDADEMWERSDCPFAGAVISVSAKGAVKMATDDGRATSHACRMTVQEMFACIMRCDEMRIGGK